MICSTSARDEVAGRDALTHFARGGPGCGRGHRYQVNLDGNDVPFNFTGKLGKLFIESA